MFIKKNYKGILIPKQTAKTNNEQSLHSMPYLN